MSKTSILTLTLYDKWLRQTFWFKTNRNLPGTIFSSPSKWTPTLKGVWQEQTVLWVTPSAVVENQGPQILLFPVVTPTVAGLFGNYGNEINPISPRGGAFCPPRGKLYFWPLNPMSLNWTKLTFPNSLLSSRKSKKMHKTPHPLWHGMHFRGYGR